MQADRKNMFKILELKSLFICYKHNDICEYRIVCTEYSVRDYSILDGNRYHLKLMKMGTLKSVSFSFFITALLAKHCVNAKRSVSQYCYRSVLITIAFRIAGVAVHLSHLNPLSVNGA